MQRSNLDCDPAFIRAKSLPSAPSWREGSSRSRGDTKRRARSEARVPSRVPPASQLAPLRASAQPCSKGTRYPNQGWPLRAAREGLSGLLPTSDSPETLPEGPQGPSAPPRLALRCSEGLQGSGRPRCLRRAVQTALGEGQHHLLLQPAEAEPGHQQTVQTGQRAAGQAPQALVPG